MCGAAAALAGVILLGPRAGKYNEDGSINAMPGANMPLATLGTFILWFGWFGFNGGSELKLSNIDEANAVAQVFVNTNMAAACGSSSVNCFKASFGKADITMALMVRCRISFNNSGASFWYSRGVDDYWSHWWFDRCWDPSRYWIS